MKYTLKRVLEKPFLHCKDNVVTKVNKDFINLTGYSNKELIGKSLIEIGNMFNISSQIKLHKIQERHICYLFTKEFEPIEVLMYCEKIDNQSKKIIFIKDNLKQTVKEKFNFAKQLCFDNKTGVSIISVPNLILLSVDENYLKYLNKPYNRIKNCIGKKHSEIIDGCNETKIKLIWNSVIATGKPYYAEEVEYNSYESGLKYWNISVVPIFVDKKLKYIINKVLDVTEKVANRKLSCEQFKIIEDKKYQLDKMKEKLIIQDEMFSNISHELKTPLNVIFSTNQLMEYYLKNGLLEVNKHNICRGINIIKQNCYRFTKIINNIIDISKIESGFFKLNLSNENIVNIIEQIVQSVSDYIKVKGLNIIFDTNTEEKIIACDPDKIERIILNIISNAVKFTNINGSIFVNIIDKGDTVEISVKDTGIGMNEDQLQKIFERFHQVDNALSRNSEGSGIGLALVKLIVDLHKGKISVDSKVNEGSIFKIEIPAITIEKPKVVEESKLFNRKIEMINIEFSDIYSI